MLFMAKIIVSTQTLEDYTKTVPSFELNVNLLFCIEKINICFQENL